MYWLSLLARTPTKAKNDNQELFHAHKCFNRYTINFLFNKHAK
jgi:hypothetical protein